MGVPHEKQNILRRDWVVVSLLWCATLFVTLLVWRLATFVQLKQKEIKKKTSNVSNGTPVSPRSMSMSASYPTQQSAPIRFLFQRDVLNVVNVTAVFIWLMLVLDCISWTYCVIFKVWDWFMIVVDGLCIAVGGLSSALLLLVFMQRTHTLFSRTPYQYSARIYNVLAALILLVAILGILMGAFTGGLQWKLVALSAIVFVVVYALTCSVLIWMLFSPLHKMALELKNDKILHVAVRITFLSVLSLVSTSVNYLLAAIAYNECEECLLTYGYYVFGSIDAVLNVLCLTWSLKHGNEEYLKVCGCAHSRLFKKLNNKENVVDQMQQADDGL